MNRTVIGADQKAIEVWPIDVASVMRSNSQGTFPMNNTQLLMLYREDKLFCYDC